MTKVSNKVTLSKSPIEQPELSKFAKSNTHRDMNDRVLEHFKVYEESLTLKDEGKPMYLYLTITFNQKILRSLDKENRSAFIQRVYEYLWWRMHDKLKIKRPLTTKTHQHLLMRQYRVIEDVDRYGNRRLEHLHIICGVHPKFHDTMDNKLYWESVIASRQSFTVDEMNQTFSCEEITQELHIQPIRIDRKTDEDQWADLINVIDYANKGLSRIDQGKLVTGEILNQFNPHTATTITKENTYGTQQRTRPVNRYG
tara:strand:+ start:600 stop:1364 length:765 start_codon:yes stop_codon:yes gene_type:complete